MPATHRGRRRGLLVLMALGLLGVPVVAGPAPAATAAPAPKAAAPSPTPARPGKPTVVAAVGDSITQSTGTGALSVENPVNSWATGSEVNSVAARLGVSTLNRFNLAANGDKMTDFAGQVQNGKSGGSGAQPALPATTGLVLVEFGGNDLCKDSVADMTAVETYRAQFVAGLAAVKAKAPNALIQVMSVPDIYNLWYIRGAPQNGTYHPEPESDQASSPPYYNGARFYWGISFFPCQSLLSNPDSYDAADRQRRQDVRTRNKAYNAVLAEECAKVLRCRFDDNGLFTFTSNRASTPDGPLLPQAQWRFVDGDISRNTGTGVALCPVSGLVGGGCGDHFHPSKQGQGKIADAAWLLGRNWSDTTAPTASLATTTAARANGTFPGRATVRFDGSDAGGLRGQEVRVHKPDGSVTPWAESIGRAPNLVVDTVGTSYVEVRSLDVNGNLSASKILKVVVTAPEAPGAVGRPALSADASGLKVAWSPPSQDGGADITGYRVETFVDRPGTSTGSVVVTGAASRSAPVSAVAGRLVAYRVRAVNPVGIGTPSILSPATVAPFGNLRSFVARQYLDFAGRLPTEAEWAAGEAALDAGSKTPAGFAKSLSDAPYWDGAIGGPTRLYKAYFLRLPDKSGLDYWAGRRRGGVTLTTISNFFARSSEFERRYGELSDPDFVDKIYGNVFGRLPDPSGQSFWVSRLEAGWTRGEVMLQFSESSEYRRKTASLVTSVELTRAMFSRMVTAADLPGQDAAFTASGHTGVFRMLIADPEYITRPGA